MAIYPTPAPQTAECLIEASMYEAIEQACGYLYAAKGSLSSEQKKHIHTHFQQLFGLMDSSYHLELWMDAKAFQWEDYWKSLKQFFPQFAWLRVQREVKPYDRSVYRFDFIPLVSQEKSFPFAINLEASLSQQFGIEAKKALEQADRLLLELAEKQVRTKKKKAFADTQTVPLAPQVKEEAQKLSTTLPAATEEHQDNQSKARLKALNQQLELMIEKLELSMLYSGIRYFDHDLQEEEGWDRRMTISLREYTYLLQKAKFLEQVWQLNSEVVNKTEKMTLNGSSLVYERNQVKKIKENLSSKDIHFILYECQVIESRVKIHPNPWFRKPYVRLMKMDYDNLLNKAAYFDLLQGETALLEKRVRGGRESSQAVKDAEESD
nr:hypothetical protein [Enterococcus sp. 665A]